MGELMDRFKRLKVTVHIICEVLEMIAAALMLVGILFSTCSLIRNVDLFRELLLDTSSFRGYMDQIFMLVIGIEFLVMLCKPNSENVIEVLIFLVARHMIVGETTPYQDFVSVVSVALLCVVRRYLRINNEKRDEKKAAGILEEKLRRAKEEKE
ncbi:MAG: hypothetical protein HFI98_11395 [Lachnospiraceae bacterium]|jgi:uncharacterized membrane protein (DUF373 family)|nr:hypothetical protein [Lachnospiraceae bacterium]MCI9095069.1 hypothetical protein [Lachnospiraceae bacterium]MCI9203157.1 hypothetical protein [Lachnospiraceae bacterium]MCI9335323.1 hypothetical protein [Lachnospiraceae bacterium]